MEPTPNEPNPAAFPGVDLAYDLAVASYEVAIKRLDSVDGRIQTLMAFAISTTAITFSLAVGRGRPLRSLPFYLAAASVLLAIIIGTYARVMGQIRLLEPNKFYSRWLRKDEWTFKKDFIYFAGQDFDDNMKLVNRKWCLSLIAILLFALEGVFLAVWALAARLP